MKRFFKTLAKILAGVVAVLLAFAILDVLGEIICKDVAEKERQEFISLLVLLPVGIYLAWRLLKFVIYQLVFTAIKAIEDAKIATRGH